MDVLANWLLQGSALAAATTMILRVIPRLSATTRYRVWWIALAIVLGLPVLNWSPLQPIAQPDGVTASTYEVQIPAMPWWPVALALFAYLSWTSWSLARIVRAFVQLRIAKRRCRDLSLRRQNRLPRWRALRDQGRRARLVVSPDVRSASVLGLTSPAIAVAPTLLRVLEDEELDCILVHEWAHIQRRDDFARLLQVLLRAIAGLHPAVWWIDRQLHINRETACDDWTINLTGSAKKYAACLTKLAALNLAAPQAVLLPAVLSPRDLSRRVTQLLDRRRSTSTKQPATVTAMSLTLLVALGAFVAGIQLVRPTAVDLAMVDHSTGPAPSQPLTPATRQVEPAASTTNAPSPVRRRPHTDTKTAEASVAEKVSTPTPRVESAAPSPRLPLAAPAALKTTSEIPAVTVSDLNTAVGLPHAAPIIPAAPEGQAATPWGAAADAGVNIGKGSKQAGVATAGFFSRLGKSIARSF